MSAPAPDVQVTRTPAVEASLWSADLTALGADIDRMQQYVDAFHIDASDTRFVEDALFFPDLVAALRPRTKVPFHVHLMAHHPDYLIDAFAEAGADLITVHAEAAEPLRTLELIKSHGKSAGIALRLDSPIETVAPCLDLAEVILMIGTPLGTKGTCMDPAAPDRITAMRRLLTHHRQGAAPVPIIADGGIRTSTVASLTAAGADAVVAGSLLFGSPDPAQTAAWIRQQHPMTTGAQP